MNDFCLNFLFKYLVELLPAHHNVQAEVLPSISHSPHHVNVSNQSSPRGLAPVSQITPLNFNDLPSSHRSKTKQQSSQRSRTIHESLNRSLSHSKNEKQHFNLKDILAQNRARRGSRIPKPRREIDEEELHEKPIGNRDFIKDDLLIHK